MSKQEASERTLKGSRLPKGFYLKESLVIGNGNVLGLHTDHAIKKGDYIGEYIGKQLTPNEAKSIRSKYLFEVRDKGKPLFVLDGKNKKFSSFVRYANAANFESEQNTHFIQHTKRIYLQAIKNIKPDNEILTWYGDGTADIIKKGYSELRK